MTEAGVPEGEARPASAEQHRQKYVDAFDELQQASNSHAKIDRTTGNLDAIVDSRRQLEGTRRKTRAARKGIVSRYEPPATDVVHSHGSHRATKFSIVAAAVGVVLLFGSLIGAFVYLKQAVRPDLAIDFGEQITLTTDRPCTMTVSVEITNSGEVSYTVRLISRRVNGRNITVDVPNLEVAALTTETVDVSFAIESLGGCPTLETVDSQTITVEYRPTNNPSGVRLTSVSKNT